MSLILPKQLIQKGITLRKCDLWKLYNTSSERLTKRVYELDYINDTKGRTIESPSDNKYIICMRLL